MGSGTNGDNSRVSRWLIADNSGATGTGSNSRGTNDFTGGTVDALVDTMAIGRGENGNVGSGNVADALFYLVEDVRTNPPASYRNGDAQRTATGEIVFIPP